MDICRLQGLSLELADSCILVGDPIHLLLLNRRRGNIHAQNDVLNLALSQTCNVDVVLLRIVCQNQVL